MLLPSLSRSYPSCGLPTLSLTCFCFRVASLLAASGGSSLWVPDIKRPSLEPRWIQDKTVEVELLLMKYRSSDQLSLAATKLYLPMLG